MTSFLVEIDIISDSTEPEQLFDNLRNALIGMERKKEIRSHWMVVNTKDGKKSWNTDDQRDHESEMETRRYTNYD